MNVTDLAEQIANSHELGKAQAREIIESVFSAITQAATSGDEVALPSFGKFKVADRAARQGRNPSTGEVIQIAASRKLAFTAAKSVRDKLNAGHDSKPAAKTKAAPPAPAKKPAVAAKAAKG
jgi:DNA-binding protein HU-beta